VKIENIEKLKKGNRYYVVRKTEYREGENFSVKIFAGTFTETTPRKTDIGGFGEIYYCEFKYTDKRFGFSELCQTKNVENMFTTKIEAVRMAVRTMMTFVKN